MTITDTQYNELEKKYGKLIHKIANWISGDKMTASHDDNVQELWMVLLQTVETFSRINEQSYDEFKDTEHWNKYVKTALWNNKNSKGRKLTNKAALLKDALSTWGLEEVLSVADNTYEAMETELHMGELPALLNEEEAAIVKAVVSDPDLIKPNGRINKLALSRELGLRYSTIDKTLQDIGERLENVL
jgi:hypothetical protein